MTVLDLGYGSLRKYYLKESSNENQVTAGLFYYVFEGALHFISISQESHMLYIQGLT